MMGEFYAATEGNVPLFNFLGKTGSIGFVSPLLRNIFPLKIAKYDVLTDDFVRNKNGFLIECGTNEPGHLLGLINEDDPTRQFSGYTNKEATTKKIVKNAFVKGDVYFCTGDLIRIDKEGFAYFVDRIGDTFRWKGENVSTNEVSEVISQIKGVHEANVYGVAIPGFDGRAGMASL